MNRFNLVIAFVVANGLYSLTICQACKEYDAYELACQEILDEDGELLL